MKILHVCLASHYTEGMTYQDNQLPDQNAADGHEVVVVSDCFKYENGDLVKVPEEDRVLLTGVRLVRMEYDKLINDFLSSKVRKVSGLYDFMVSESPDVILFHGVAGYEMLSVAKYKKNSPNVKLYIDSHEDLHNSGTVWLSLFFQYKIFNRYIVNRIKNYVDKFLFLSYESRDFLLDVYGLDDHLLEFYPLGGDIVSEIDKSRFSTSVRQRHGYKAHDILIVHTGKLSSGKKTKELLQAFSKVESTRLKLLIIGSIPAEQKTVLDPLILKDSRISYLGWKSSSELIEYLSAADLYFQPGTQSATMQNAICCGTAIALYPYSSHQPYLKDNGFFVKDKEDYSSVFNSLLSDPTILTGMGRASYHLGRKVLDYKILASRLYK
jgi:hypothetical protein